MKAPRPVLPPGKRLAIFDRDATIISSRRTAYACYREAFVRVISPARPALRPVSVAAYWGEYHPFEPDLFYRRRYGDLPAETLAAVKETTWRYYLQHCRDPELNRPISGMPGLIRDLTASGTEVVILTAGDFDGAILRGQRIPFSECYSMVRMKAAGLLKNKIEAVDLILSRRGLSPAEAVTVGDNPNDHVPGVTSVGAGFGLGSSEARHVLRRSVEYYADTVAQLRRILRLLPRRCR